MTGSVAEGLREAGRVDHLVMPFASLAIARQWFEALGFTVAPDAAHPFGTGNCCVFFADGSYLEPLADVAPDRYDAARREENRFVGRDADFRASHDLPAISAVAFASADVAGDIAGLDGAGLADGMLEFSRPFRKPDGTASALSFRLGFARDPQGVGGPFFLCQALHAEAPDRSHLTRHANGVLGIARIVLSHENPAGSRELVEAVTAVPAEEEAGGSLMFRAANAVLEALTPHDLAERYGITPQLEAGLQINGVVLRARDLEAVRRCIPASEPFGGRLVVRLEPGAAFIAFEQEESA